MRWAASARIADVVGREVIGFLLVFLRTSVRRDPTDHVFVGVT